MSISSFEDYCRAQFVAEVRGLIAARALTKNEWWFWRRYERFVALDLQPEADETLRRLVRLIDLRRYAAAVARLTDAMLLPADVVREGLSLR